MYPLGTFVARDFGKHGKFWGTVTKHYPDDPNVCEVTFTDGDKEDLDSGQLQYAVEYYKQEFATHDD